MNLRKSGRYLNFLLLFCLFTLILPCNGARNDVESQGVVGFVRRVLKGTIFGYALDMLPGASKTPQAPSRELINEKFIHQALNRLNDIKETLDDHAIQNKITEIHRPYEAAIEPFIIDIDHYLGDSGSEYYHITMSEQCRAHRWPYKSYYSLAKHTHFRELRKIANHSPEAYHQMRKYLLSMIGYAGVIDAVCWNFYQNGTLLTPRMREDHRTLYANASRYVADIRAAISETDDWVHNNQHALMALKVTNDAVNKHNLSAMEQAKLIYRNLSSTFEDTSWAVICYDLRSAVQKDHFVTKAQPGTFHNVSSERLVRNCFAFFTAKSSSDQLFDHVLTDDPDFDLIYDVDRIEFTLHRVTRSPQILSAYKNILVAVMNNANNDIGMQFDVENFQEFELSRDGTTKQRILIGWEDGDSRAYTSNTSDIDDGLGFLL